MDGWGVAQDLLQMYHAQLELQAASNVLNEASTVSYLFQGQDFQRDGSQMVPAGKTACVISKISWA